MADQSGRTPSPDKVLVDRADVVALLEAYQAHRGVNPYYRGDPLIERVRVALTTPARSEP